MAQGECESANESAQRRKQEEKIGDTHTHTTSDPKRKAYMFRKLEKIVVASELQHCSEQK